MTPSRAAAARLIGRVVSPVPALVFSASLVAQTAELRTAHGLHTVVFRTAHGALHVHLPDDAAPGDAIAGTVVAEPAGALNEPSALSRYTVVLHQQRQPVSATLSRWTIPAGIRSGAVLLAVHDPAGRLVAECRIPIDGVPALPGRDPPSARAADFEIPRTAQSGQPLAVRGPIGSAYHASSLRLGAGEAPLLAASPRKLVFRAPPGLAGPTPLHFRHGGMALDGSLRLIRVEIASAQAPSLRGRNALLTVVVSGLRGIEEPISVTVANFSPEKVRLEGGTTQSVEIEPRQVRADGAFTLTRGLTVLTPGPLDIRATAAPPPFRQFEVRRTVGRALANWEAANQIPILPEAREDIAEGILDQRLKLDEFLRRQQALGGEPPAILAALVSHYCFDIRDEKLRRTPPAARARFVSAFAQPAPARVEINAGDVRSFSFAQFLSRLLARFASQPVGYLLIRSVPERGEIAIDNQRKSELTNRRFVASVGDHLVTVKAGAHTCRERVRVEQFQVRTMVCQR